MGRPFYILSLDGGGCRGAYSAHILKRIEAQWQIDWRAKFGMFAGTSTGAILAAGLASGRSAEKLSGFYTTKAGPIFRRRACSWFDPLKLTASRYSQRKLRQVLAEEFGAMKLGEVPVPLLMPAVDIGNGCVHVLKSKYSDGFVRDENVLLAEAVLASSSAPTYFDPHFLDGKYHLADGGLWANNPSLAAVIDAKYRLGVPLEDIRMLSIGTGKCKSFYPYRTSWWEDFLRSWQGWGFATKWKAGKLLDLILNLQSDNAHNSLCLLLGESPLDSNHVLRLTFESETPLPMDSTRKLVDWVTKADHTFTHYATKISNFLDLKEPANA